jgi:hypothetical protein
MSALGALSSVAASADELKRVMATDYHTVGKSGTSGHRVPNLAGIVRAADVDRDKLLSYNTAPSRHLHDLANGFIPKGQ